MTTPSEDLEKAIAERLKRRYGNELPIEDFGRIAAEVVEKSGWHYHGIEPDEWVREAHRLRAERDKLRALLQRARSRLSLLSAAASLVSRGIEEGGHDILGMHVLKKYQQAAELSITDIDAYLSPEQEQRFKLLRRPVDFDYDPDDKPKGTLVDVGDHRHMLGQPCSICGDKE